ncbi:hypothetical protein D7Y56_00845 (plasmid) [Streptomyces sp. S501]|nr:hypothetical protein D7Y56_00845 [Streptomyces sp. S501]
MPSARAPAQGFNSNGAMDWLRRWVTSPAGERLGLEPIPDRPVHPRSLRRTLAVEMASSTRGAPRRLAEAAQRVHRATPAPWCSARLRWSCRAGGCSGTGGPR